MEEDLYEIIKASIKGDIDLRAIREASERVAGRFKRFTDWKDDPRCPFITHYNGTEPDQERISYDKGNKNYNIEGVWKFWSEMKH